MKGLKATISCLLTLVLLATTVVGALPVSAAEWTETELSEKDFDYGFATGYNENVSYLDDDFTVYQYNRAPASASAAAAKATNTPSDQISANENKNAIFTNGLTGFKVFADGLGLATYKTKEYTNFYAEYGVAGSGQRYGFVFGGTLGNMGLVNDTDTTNDTAVYVTVRETGEVYIAGAVDPTSVDTSATKITTAEYIINTVLGSNIAWVGADLGDDKTSATICVDVKDGYVTVSRKDESTSIKVKLTDAYVGGYTSLFMSNSSGGMFTSFGIRSEDPEIVERDTVYLSASGADTNTGDSEASAVATLARAMKLVKDSGTIHVAGTYPLTEFVATTKEVTYVGGTLDFSGVSDEYVRMQGPATFGDVTVKFKSGPYVYWLANHHKLVVSADAIIEGTPNVFGGKQISTFTDTYTGNTHVELYAGTYLTVGAGNRRGGMVGTSYVKVGGTAQITDLLGGIGADYGLMKGDVKMYIDGGTITNVYGGSSHQGIANSVYIEMNGGTVESLYGGNKAANMKHMNYSTDGTLANVEIVLNGGTVTRRVYGGCYNDVTTTNMNKVYGTVTVTVKEGFTFGTHASWEGIRAGSRTKVADYETDCAETTTLTIDDLAAYTAVKAYLRGADSSSMKQYNIINTTDTLNIPENAENGEITVTSVDNGNGTWTSTITVTPKPGYELQAGSLLAQDASGNLYVPMRDGFRDTLDGTQYIVVASSAVTATGTFIQPTADTPNIGNLGNSVHTGTSGLRFISRVNRIIEDNVAYVTLSGEKKAIKDYGMLVAAEMMLEDEELSLELLEKNHYVTKASIWDKNVYFDFCNEYVDMSVRIINIESVDGAADMSFVARPYVVYDDGSGNDAVLYGDAWDCTYNEAAQNKNSPMTDLLENDQLVTLGRAGIIDGEYAMDYVGSGFKISGTLQGAVKAELVNEIYTDLVNVIIDGELSTVEVPKGTSTVTLATGLAYGEHTIEVMRGSTVDENYNTFTVKNLTYNGSLSEIKPDNNRLKIEVIGDSISAGYGIDYVEPQGGYNDVAIESNGYYTYAAQTARELDADLSVVAWPNKKTAEISALFKKTSHRSASDDWDFDAHRADIVLVNLGTNDEEDNVGATKALADAKALLADVREAYPDAYIIWVYGMMRKDYEDTVYKKAVSEMNTAGDDKVFCVDMSAHDKNEGLYGHPLRASHTAVATDLVAFIKNKCADMIGHRTHTDTMKDLSDADTVLFNGRTTVSGTARTMTYGSTGMTLSGYLYGDMTLSVSRTSSIANINVVVDGDVANVKTIRVEAGNHEISIYENLPAGEHTVEILLGTSANAAVLTMKEVTYTGTLTKPDEKDLQIEFIGDSITVGEGMYLDYELSNRYDSYNNFYGYAPQTARALGAGLTLEAICGHTTQQMRALFNDKSCDSGLQQKDIVVINLCTNDVWSLTSSNAANRQAVLNEITGLLTDVRAAYPNAYIVWAFGSMPVMGGANMATDYVEQCVPLVKTQVEAFAETDEKVFFCDMSSVKNGDGVSDHPILEGHNAQAEYLTQFLRTNCADALA